MGWSDWSLLSLWLCDSDTMYTTIDRMPERFLSQSFKLVNSDFPALPSAQGLRIYFHSASVILPSYITPSSISLP